MGAGQGHEGEAPDATHRTGYPLSLPLWASWTLGDIESTLENMSKVPYSVQTLSGLWGGLGFVKLSRRTGGHPEVES